MIKIFSIIALFLMLSPIVVFAKETRPAPSAPRVAAPDSKAKISELENKIAILESRIELNERSSAQVLQSQSSNYAISVTVVLFLAGGFVGFQFLSIKSNLQRLLQMGIEQLNTKFKNEITILQSENLKMSLELKIQDDKNFNALSAKIYDVLGRMYYDKAIGQAEKCNETYAVSAMWYARCLSVSKTTSLEDKKNILEKINLTLKKSVFTKETKFIVEFSDILEEIDEQIFPVEKKDLKENFAKSLS